MRKPWMWLGLAMLTAAWVVQAATEEKKAPAADAKGAPAKAEAKPAVPEAKPADAKPASETKAPAADAKPAKAIAPPPPKGSQLVADKVLCVQCHTEGDLWDAQNRRLYINKADLAVDSHFLKGVNCHDCHGGNPSTDNINEAHAKEDGFRAKADEIKQYCNHCHKNQAVEIFKGVHGKIDAAGNRLDCTACHGKVSHHLLPVRDPKSNVFLDHQVKTCGACHKEKLESYDTSVHGFGLHKAGLLVTASCADCHGAHGIYYTRDQRSTLHSTKVAQTCGKCHRFVAERLAQSVHGMGPTNNDQAERLAPGGKSKQKPTCTSCHEGHNGANPTSLAFRAQMPNLCGNCHANLSGRYAMSVHGELTRLGYGPAAKCSDCHGSHEILPASNPASTLSTANKLETCKKCHEHTQPNFLAFDPHADHTDAERSPLLHGIYVALMSLLFTVFGVFGVHSVLWFVRGLWDVLFNGRPRGMTPGGVAYVRFTPYHRHVHSLLLVSFLGLAVTGLPLKYSDTIWGQRLAIALGGFANTSIWHRLFAVVQFACFLVFIGVMITGVWKKRKTGLFQTLFGPDSPVPNFRDFKDAFAMVRWFFGLGKKPSFERWTYWEKFDFWGAVGDVLIIGLTGLILWLPNLFTSFLPGITLNIAKVIHSTQALLATGFVFAIHFFNTHLRPEKFPADMSILTGLVSEEEMEHERPDYFRRLNAEGRLEQLRATVPSWFVIRVVQLAGFLALLVGLALLFGMVWAALGG